MHQGSDHGYCPHYYHPNPSFNPTPNPSPADYPQLTSNSSYASASAPPLSPYPALATSSPDYPSPYPSTYPPYSAASEPAGSNLQPQHQPYPPLQSSYNPSPYPDHTEQQASATYPNPQQPYYAPDPQLPSSNYGSTGYPSYDNNPYESSGVRYDAASATYLGENAGRYGAGLTGSLSLDKSSSGYNQDMYDKRTGIGGSSGYDHVGFQEDMLRSGASAGVYRYDGGGSEPYGARGTGGLSRSSGSLVEFDDYGRSLRSPSAGKEHGSGLGKIARAVPKADTQQDAKSGVQKFRVKLMAEGSGQSALDVLCQIGLDGIRMLDPSSGRTLRIYPLETVMRWDVSDPSIYTFWSKTSVDIDSRRIRLQSNRYTTSTILDTVAAATVQLKEMGGKEMLVKGKGSSDMGKQPEQPGEKKKPFDWMNFIKPASEEKDHWVPDDAVNRCTSCGSEFSPFVRRHHCRNCGDIFCDKCTHGRISLTADDNAQQVRVCDRCMTEVTLRLSNTKEVVSKSAVVHSHEDLAKKLQEEMDRNRKSSGTKSSEGTGRLMREVACPTCTVHLQVQVPSSGSETIECGVCQHPFLVSAH